MADGIDISVEFPELQQIKDAFELLPRNIAAKHMGAALNKTIEPAFRLLKQLTPQGPTGNLKRAIAKKVKRYTGSPKSRNPAKSPGAAVALAGYVAPPRKRSEDLGKNQRGSHGGFLEFGTKQRRTKSNIASSFKRTGSIKSIVSGRSGKVISDPKPPKGFIRVVRKGETVDLGSFPIGGKGGVPPVRTAYERSLPAMKSVLAEQMTVSLNNALKEMASPFGKGRR